MRSPHGLIRGLLSACLLLFLLPRKGALASGADASRVQVVDGTGRTLLVPAKIQRVYVTSPVAIVMLYSLAPEKMVGWNYPLGAAEKHFILPAVRELPALGGWFGENGKGNRETLLASKPEVILSIGYQDKAALEFADRLREQVGIPVFVASGRLEDTADTYEKLGALLGVPERAKLLADYSRTALAEARTLAASIPAKERVSCYYAEGLRGLQTDTKGSMHTEALDYFGIDNVAQGPATSGFGRISTSLDQVITWQPDVILACPEKLNANGNWTPEWLDNPTWKQVPAVAKGRIYLIPGAPFNWLDRPPSAARLLGLKWLAWALYPEHVTFDMVAETQRFFRLFYWYDLSETEARQLLDASKPKN